MMREKIMSKLEQLEFFCQAVESKSFAKAAKQLNISAVAVGKQINKLEKRLGVQLLQRTTRKNTLTSAGKALYEKSKVLLIQMAEAERTAVLESASAKGRLKIASSIGFGEQFLIPAISLYKEQYPEIEITLMLKDSFPDLDEEDIDLIFGMTIAGKSHWVRKRVGKTRHIFCASPEYLEKWGTPKSPVELNKYHYITHINRPPHLQVITKGNLQVVAHSLLQMNHSQAMLQCALRGMGICQLHEYIVLPYLNEKKLVLLLEKDTEAYRPIYVYFRKNSFMPQRLKVFINRTIEVFEGVVP
jgi:DNA-binding transcriptional LysR family regulator